MSAKLKALRDFLDSSPPVLTLKDSGFTSTATRRTAKYDMHFAQRFQLQRIASLPNLPDDLSRLVDQKLKNIDASKIPFPTADLKTFKANYSKVSSKMTDEASVMNFYDKTTATPCAQVASFLEFLTPELANIFCWTPEKDQRLHAIYEGALKIDADAFEKAQSSLTARARNDVKAVLRFNPTMAPWEEKSLTAAPEKSMRALVEYAQAGGSFDWTCCDKAAKCGPSHFASNESGSGKAMTGARMGFDAPSPWILSRGTKRKLDDEDDEDDSNDRTYLDETSHKKTKLVFQQVRTFLFYPRDFTSKL